MEVPLLDTKGGRGLFCGNVAVLTEGGRGLFCGNGAVLTERGRGLICGVPSNGAVL